MYWIVTLIVGAIVGWLASILMKTNAQMGAIANIVVGIIGSSLGFWLAGVLGLSTGGPHRGLGCGGAGGRPADLHPEGGRNLHVTRSWFARSKAPASSSPGRS